ncbi:MAG: AMP-binding protein [Candidatus Tectimicrobiota bacterium]
MTQLIPLFRLLTAAYPPEHLVCWHPQKTWAELQSVVAGLVAQLPDPSARPWLVACGSTFSCAAALLACWQKGLAPVLTPDVQPGTLQQFAPHIAGLITDHQTVEIATAIVRPTPGETLPVWIEPDPQARALVLLTSGSTGARQYIPKTFAQLANEVAVLHRQWGLRVAGTPRFATVSHLHIYGLLFRLLWPLCSGDGLVDGQYVHWEELLGRLPSAGATLVSSPASLVHLPQAATRFGGDWRHTVIFSSGGPLARETALDIAEVCGQAPIEVLGSTETGGIAFRQQTLAGNWPWQPLPGVVTRVVNGLLEVRSPFLPDPTVWCPTGDRAEPVDEQQFHLRGRADRIIKLSEKRLSCTAMEDQLAQHDAVAEVRIVLLPTQAPTERPRLAAVVVLTPLGQHLLQVVGTSTLIRTLRDHLVHDFEPVTLPRRWRFPATLPYNSEGKVTEQSLLGLFHATPPASYPTEPVLVAREPTDAGYLLHYTVPENLYYLTGHFPQVPVVPGVCQLSWVIKSIETCCERPLQVRGLEAIKFHRMLFPGQTFALDLRFDQNNSKWVYRIFSEDQTFASGRLLVLP